MKRKRKTEEQAEEEEEEEKGRTQTNKKNVKSRYLRSTKSLRFFIFVCFFKTV
ncbi:hypothetical protein WN48_09303 [Eufriesea mexicana]|uniref:Uncharacterized protein n=1 Tax=Eufriesea mexicana TaxID=516756 RepID=A0A310SSR7_9HYME|nr:hypothetical protein WN48_09303 [Eufriesea mexicana]